MKARFLVSASIAALALAGAAHADSLVTAAPHVSASGNVYWPFGTTTLQLGTKNAAGLLTFSPAQLPTGSPITWTVQQIFNAGLASVGGSIGAGGLLVYPAGSTASYGQIYNDGGFHIAAENASNGAIYESFGRISFRPTASGNEVGYMSSAAPYTFSYPTILANTLAASATTASTSTTTGAITTPGGLGVGGSANIGGAITTAGVATHNAGVVTPMTDTVSVVAPVVGGGTSGPIGNPLPTLSTISMQGTTSSTSTREFGVALGMNATTGIGSLPLSNITWSGGVATYTTSAALSLGTGSAFISVSGAAPSGYNFGGYLALSNLTWSGGTATATTSAAIGLSTGTTFPVNVSQASPQGYEVNGVTATVTGANTFTYPLANNPGAVSQAGTYLILATITGTNTFTYPIGTNPGTMTAAGTYLGVDFVNSRSDKVTLFNGVDCYSGNGGCWANNSETDVKAGYAAGGAGGATLWEGDFVNRDVNAGDASGFAGVTQSPSYTGATMNFIGKHLTGGFGLGAAGTPILNRGFYVNPSVTIQCSFCSYGSQGSGLDIENGHAIGVDTSNASFATGSALNMNAGQFVTSKTPAGSGSQLLGLGSDTRLKIGPAGVAGVDIGVSTSVNGNFSTTGAIAPVGGAQISNGTYSDPAPGVAYDAKIGGPGNGIAVAGASLFKANLTVGGSVSAGNQSTMSNGSFTDPAPGVGYDLKLGGPGAGIAVAGASLFNSTLKAPGLATSGGTVKGSLCVDTSGNIYVKTSSGSCL